MSSSLRITNTSNMSILISDINISLPGRGSYSDISIDLARSSKILPDFVQKKWVKTKVLDGSRKMPHWPFYTKPKPVPSHPNSISSALERPPRSHPDSQLKSGVQPVHAPIEHKADPVLAEIRDLLKIIASKQSPSAEVLAAHMVAQSSKLQGVPVPGAVHVRGIMGGSPDEAPEFIPSRIMPEKSLDISIKSKSSEVDKSDFDATAAALRELKKR